MLNNDGNNSVGVIKELAAPVEQYKGRIVRVATQQVQFPDGTEKTFEFAERSPGVRILTTDGDRILLTREWRAETKSWDYRLPGGKVFDSLEEYLEEKKNVDFDINTSAAIAAKKELQEETSLDIDLESFKFLRRSVCGTTVIWDLYYFSVNVSSKDIDEQPTSIITEEGEHTHPEWFTAEEVQELCLNNLVQEDRTAAVLFRYILSGKLKN